MVTISGRGHDDRVRSWDKQAGYLVLFEVRRLEVVAQLGIEVVPKTEGLSSVCPHEGVSASTGDASNADVASAEVGRWQSNLNWEILYGFFSITQPTKNK